MQYEVFEVIQNRIQISNEKQSSKMIQEELSEMAIMLILKTQYMWIKQIKRG